MSLEEDNENHFKLGVVFSYPNELVDTKKKSQVYIQKELLALYKSKLDLRDNAREKVKQVISPAFHELLDEPGKLYQMLLDKQYTIDFQSTVYHAALFGVNKKLFL